MNKNIANIFVLSTLLTAGFVIGTAFAEDTAAPVTQPMETAQATTPESAAKTEPVKVDDAKPAADASASAPASPATTPAASPSPAPAGEHKEAPAAPAADHK